MKDYRERTSIGTFEFNGRSYEFWRVTPPGGDPFYALAYKGPESQLFFDGDQIGDAVDVLAAELGKALDERAKMRGILADKSPEDACRELRTLLD